MNALRDEVAGLARLTLQNPRAAARVLLAMGVPLPARTVGLLLMAVVSALLMHVGFLILPPADDPVASLLMQSPLRTAVMQWAILVVSVFLIYRVGRAWGGKGSLPDALLVVVWLQVIMLGVQLIQLVLLVLSPPLAAIANLGGLVLFFWLMSSFVAELHGFASRGAVLAGILATGFGVVMIIVVLLVLFLGPEAFVSV